MNRIDLETHLECLEYQRQHNSDCRYRDLFGVPVEATCLTVEIVDAVRRLTGQVTPELQRLLETKTCCEVVDSKLLG